MARESLVRFEIRDGVAIATLDDSATLNALGADLVAGLLHAIQRASDDANVRVFLLRGTGRAFCAGADLSEIKRRLDLEPPTAAEYIGELMEQGGDLIVKALHALPKPSIAAVNGVAAGGGVGLALAADIVIAARSAYFYLPFIPALGLVPDIGAAWSLLHKIGRARAIGLALTGHKLSAEQAETWGLIWRCAPDEDFEAETEALARKLAALPGEATKAFRGLVDGAVGADFAAAVSAGSAAQRRLAATESFREGVNAFVAKRKPKFD